MRIIYAALSLLLVLFSNTAGASALSQVQVTKPTHEQLFNNAVANTQVMKSVIVNYTQLTSTVSLLSSSVSLLQADVAQLKNQQTQLTSIPQLQQEVAATTDNIAALKANDISQQAALSSLQATTASLQNSQVQVTDFNLLQGKVAVALDGVKSLRADYLSVTNTLAGLNTNFSNLKVNVDNLLTSQSQLSVLPQIQASITTINSRLNDHDLQLAAITSLTSSFNSDVTALKTGQTNIEGRTGRIESSVLRMPMVADRDGNVIGSLVQVSQPGQQKRFDVYVSSINAIVPIIADTGNVSDDAQSPILFSGLNCTGKAYTNNPTSTYAAYGGKPNTLYGISNYNPIRTETWQSQLYQGQCNTAAQAQTGSTLYEMVQLSPSFAFPLSAPLRLAPGL